MVTLVLLTVHTFSSSNESMNADIVYALCSYLDLGSLFSLAAAYPSWSAIIHQYMRKKKLKVQLFLVSEDGSISDLFNFSQENSEMPFFLLTIFSCASMWANGAQSEKGMVP